MRINNLSLVQSINKFVQVGSKIQNHKSLLEDLWFSVVSSGLMEQ